MSSPHRGGQPNPLGGRSSSPLLFPSSSPRAPASASASANGNRNLAAPVAPHGQARSSSPLAFPSSSPQRIAASQGTPQAARANGAGLPLFAPSSATRAANGHNVSRRDGSDAPPSSEPLFFPSSATPKSRRARGDIHSSLPISPSPLRRKDSVAGDEPGAAPSSSAPEGSIRSGPAGRPGGPAPSLSNVGISSDALEDAERNQGARTVIWNTAVGLDETMNSFKGFLMDFKAKYRVELATRLGKPAPFVTDPEKLVYEH